MPSPKMTYPIGAKVVCIHPDSKYKGVEGVVKGHSDDGRRVNVLWKGCPDVLHYRLASLKPAPFRTKDFDPKVKQTVTGSMIYCIKTYIIPCALRPIATEQPARHSPL